MHDKTVLVRQRDAGAQEKIDLAAGGVRENASLSIPRRSPQFNLSRKTTGIIVRNAMGLKPCKIQLVQELKP